MHRVSTNRDEFLKEPTAHNELTILQYGTRSVQWTLLHSNGKSFNYYSSLLTTVQLRTEFAGVGLLFKTK